MPHKLFGVNIGQAPTHPKSPQTKPPSTPSTTASADLRRASMDFKRPSGLVHLAKKHSSDKKDGRSRSKDKDKDKEKEKPGKSSLPHSRNASPPPAAKKGPVALGVLMESPPVFFIGPPSTSTGAILSGRLQIEPLAADVVLTNVTMYLEAKRTTKRPVEKNCPQCTTHVRDLFDWNFLSKPQTFRLADGRAELPFSHLLPGDLPTTTHGHVAALDYSLHVRATAADGRTAEHRRELDIRRALIPGNDKNSTRIFPPTDLTLFVTLPHMIHPIGEFPITCRMTGLTTKRDDTQTRWRLRKLTWRIEEVEKALAPACPKHAHKLPAGADGKGAPHENTREIGMQELKSGWKTDFDAGEVEGEFLAAIDKKLGPNTGVEALSDDGTPTLKITHHLILELVIAEEWAPNRKPAQATPTGAARVLRTQFTLTVTERAGMGLSWDDEQPPVYEDVEGSPPRYPVRVASGSPSGGGEGEASGSLGAAQPAESPPHYAAQHTRVLDYEGDDLHEDVEGLDLNEA